MSGNNLNWTLERDSGKKLVVAAGAALFFGLCLGASGVYIGYSVEKAKEEKQQHRLTELQTAFDEMVGVTLNEQKEGPLYQSTMAVINSKRSEMKGDAQTSMHIILADVLGMKEGPVSNEQDWSALTYKKTGKPVMVKGTDGRSYGVAIRNNPAEVGVELAPFHKVEDFYYSYNVLDTDECDPSFLFDKKDMQRVFGPLIPAMNRYRSQYKANEASTRELALGIREEFEKKGYVIIRREDLKAKLGVEAPYAIMP